MYIRKIEIKNLWGYDFLWTLNQDVNVLIGKNGSGKSTILRMLYEAGQTHLKYKNPITTMVSATDQESYFLIKILTQ